MAFVIYNTFYTDIAEIIIYFIRNYRNTVVCFLYPNLLVVDLDLGLPMSSLLKTLFMKGALIARIYLF